MTELQHCYRWLYSEILEGGRVHEVLQSPQNLVLVDSY